MNDQSNAKQQIVEKIKNSANILVTVNTNPTVDELAAALGLTLLLDSLKKHATAVVSGEIPPAIDFLEPGKTFENTVDSLRDFIIALDKEKADHLRYKVDGDVVKIFVTPYRTTITEEDLDFSQGDYNVELVLALNVKSRDNLDEALVSHGRILHDATVATVGLGEGSKLGSIDWQDKEASSLSEMLVALSESLKDKGGKSLLDERIATAFLTGIVASTDRFSNEHTNSKVMTMAAQLMAAGANQQLIAAKLEAAEEISQPQPEARQESTRSDGTTSMSENESAKLTHSDAKDKSKPKSKSKAKPKQPKDDGALVIDHSETETRAETNQVNESEAATAAAEASLTEQLNSINEPASKAPTLSVADLQADIKSASEEVEAAADAPPGSIAPSSSPQPQASSQPPADTQLNQPPSQNDANDAISDVWAAPSYEETPAPTFGGTLNATSEAAAEAKRQEKEADRNRTILSRNPKDSRDSGGDSTSTNAHSSTSGVNVNADVNTTSSEESPDDPFKAAAEAAGLAGGQGQPTAIAPPVQPPSENAEPTLAELDSQHRAKTPDTATHDDPRAAVEAAFGAVPFDPAGNPRQNVGSQMLGEPQVGQSQPGVEVPPAPPMPDFSSLPPLPPNDLPPQPPTPQQDQSPETLGNIFGADSNSGQPPSPPPPPEDPTQFKIPGQ